MNKTFAAHLDNLYDMLLFIRNGAEALGFDEIEISKIELATEEALVNIISYGYPVTSGEIDVTCERIENDGFQVVLKDNGVPFNPLTNTKSFDPKAPVEARAVGGYGVFFITKIMDEVKYNRVEESNVLTMIKYPSTD